MRIIVVTGGIGSGKSLASGILRKEFGWPVYEADSRVKGLYGSDPHLLDDIETDLGLSLRDQTGNFMAGRLAEVIFSDPDALAKVEQRVFPALERDFREWASAQDADTVVFESATVLEKPQFDGFGDMTVVVDAPFEMRLERAMRRDGADREKVLQRMNAQKLMNDVSAGHDDPRIDVKVVNDGDVGQLRDRLVEIFG